MNEKIFKSALASLNSEQLNAVENIEGPMIVLAGPGTGKTQITALRIANILFNTDVYPSNILALTFTDSGVKAMRERLIGIIGADAYDVCISTFHGFCNMVVAEFPEKFAFKKELSAIDEVVTYELIRSIIENNSFQHIVNPKNKFFNVSRIVRDITSLKQEGISVLDAREFLKTAFEDHLKNEPDENSSKTNINAYNSRHKKLVAFEELILVYFEYQKFLRENSLFDFSDMIRFVVEKFDKDPELLAHYQEQYLYIHADEFQDSNGSQIQLINQLISNELESPNIFVVGDDDQSIYRFQGASIENFSNFIDQFKNSKKITLRQNYRSTQLILDAAKSVISNNEIRIDSNKKLVANSSNEDIKVNISHFSTQLEEFKYLADEIKELIDKGVTPSEIAVVTRNNYELQEIANFFESNEIQYSLSISTNILDNKYVTIIISLLKVIHDPANFSEFIKLLFLPYLNIDALAIYNLSKFLRSEKIESIFELTEYDDNEISALVKKLIDAYKCFGLESLANALLATLNDIGLIEYLGLSIERMDDFNSLNNFISFVNSVQAKNPEAKLLNLLNTLDSIIDHSLKIPEKSILDAKNSVQLLTAHKSKGLEFEYVYIPVAVDSKWRKQKQSNSYIPEDISVKNVDPKEVKEEEARRLFYVALTRAKKAVVISSALNYDAQNSAQELVKFVEEIDKDFVNEFKHDGLTQSELTSLYALSPKNEYKRQVELEKIKFLVENNFKMSASALNSYLKCKREFFLNRVLCVPSVQTYALSKGKLMHSLAEKYVGSNMEFSKSDLVHFIEKSPQMKYLSASETKYILTDVVDTFFEWYSFCDKNNSLPSPVHKELNFHNRQKYFENIPISGAIDVIEYVNKENDEIKIIDYKTGSPKSKNGILGKGKSYDPDYYYQLMFYKLLIESDTSLKFKPVKAAVAFMTKNQKGEFPVIDIDYNKDDYDEFKQLVKNSYEDILDLKFLDFDLEHKCKKCNYDYL